MCCWPDGNIFIIPSSIHTVKINQMRSRTYITTDDIQWALIDCIIESQASRCCCMASEIELVE